MRKRAEIRAEAHERSRIAAQRIALNGDHVGLTAQISAYLEHRDRVTIREMLQEFPLSHSWPAARMGMSLREAGWRCVIDGSATWVRIEPRMAVLRAWMRGLIELVTNLGLNARPRRGLRN
jgi:hypothetical protein